MSSIKRHKLAYKHAVEEMLGDADTTALVSSAIAELAKTGGGIAAQYQTQEAAKKKADADKKALEAAGVDARKAQEMADAAKKAAAMAAIDAQEAIDKANAVEQDPGGPMHKAAADKKKLADLAAVAAKAAASKVAFFSPSTALATTGDGGKHGKRGAGTSVDAVPWWMWALGGVAVVGGGFVAYKMLRGRK